ncbi:hypothetical protein Francci3_0790 [Frankia casuarinae]|uniref:Uncharacterized protein n=1 Tax=Frankia casuarinae (strain DSM 45818 / CECT 9043 / HFP020203 / CcI3) TaxID=106370 RepID=Q2JEW8_FRACC|nr:hypothetical protein Francci3_0790 [Frankia casuarinae]
MSARTGAGRVRIGVAPSPDGIPATSRRHPDGIPTTPRPGNIIVAKHAMARRHEDETFAGCHEHFGQPTPALRTIVTAAPGGQAVQPSDNNLRQQPIPIPEETRTTSPSAHNSTRPRPPNDTFEGGASRTNT